MRCTILFFIFLFAKLNTYVVQGCRVFRFKNTFICIFMKFVFVYIFKVHFNDLVVVEKKHVRNCTYDNLCTSIS